jgi:hypothetical protein
VLLFKFSCGFNCRPGRGTLYLSYLFAPHILRLTTPVLAPLPLFGPAGMRESRGCLGARVMAAGGAETGAHRGWQTVSFRSSPGSNWVT